MRTPLLFCLLAGTHLMAQNWTLLNPAYKYNYSFGGTDTITNQIFVTHIDTLGVDSFRYELNGVAALCDTCAGPELYLWTNGPQFLQRAVNIGSGVWHFHDPGSFVILPQAALGASWLFDTLANVQATVVLVDAIDQFGTSTPRKTVNLSNGDALLISETNGILHWNGNELVGVHGPDVGDLIPSIQQFFPYDAGDIVQYSWGEVSCHPCYGEEGTFKFSIAEGTATDSSIVYDGIRVAFTHYHQSDWNNNTSHWYTYDNGPSVFTAGSVELPFFDLIRSYPGQFIHPREWSSTYGSWTGCIARHDRTEDGHYRISCDTIQGQSHFLQIMPTQTEGMVSFVPWNYDTSPDQLSGAVYEEGTGLVLFRSAFFEGYEEFYLDGMVLNGDTMGTLLTDDQLLAVQEEARAQSTLIHPNPVSDRLSIDYGSFQEATWCILSGTGVRVLKGAAVQALDHPIDVSALPVGPYILEIMTATGMSRERFIIAR